MIRTPSQDSVRAADQLARVISARAVRPVGKRHLRHLIYPDVRYGVHVGNADARGTDPEL